ncbi:hypothetical protein KI387_020145, partial [Taxus chinensis]
MGTVGGRSQLALLLSGLVHLPKHLGRILYSEKRMNRSTECEKGDGDSGGQISAGSSPIRLGSSSKASWPNIVQRKNDSM